MPVQASAVLTRARYLLIDEGKVRWTDAELLQWLSDGQRAIAAVKPRAASKRVTFQLMSGIRQALPTDANIFLRLGFNCDVNGAPNGPAPEKVEQEILDGQQPAWPGMTPAAQVVAYYTDPSDFQGFFVYPPNTGTGFVKLDYGINPPELTSLTDNLSVDDIYQTPLVDYVCYRAHSKDSDFAAGMALAASYLAAFQGFIGGTP